MTFHTQDPTPATRETLCGGRGSCWGARRPAGRVLPYCSRCSSVGSIAPAIPGLLLRAEPEPTRGAWRGGGRGGPGGDARGEHPAAPSDPDVGRGGPTAPGVAAAPPRGRGARRGSPPARPRGCATPGAGHPRLPSLPSPPRAHIAAGGRRRPGPIAPTAPGGGGQRAATPAPPSRPGSPRVSAPPLPGSSLPPFPTRSDMAVSLAGESVPGDGGDALGMSPAGLAAYYPSFLPPAQYFEAAPDFFQPLKPLGGLVPASPPLPPFTFSRVPAFLSQPPPLPAEPFPGLPLPLYAKPPAPFPTGEGSPRGAGAPGSPPPPYPSPPRRAARSPGGGGAAGQSYRYHFTEEELNAVLYGALRSSQLAGSLHAISGLRVPPASPGKGVSGLWARGGRQKAAPCGRACGGVWGLSPKGLQAISRHHVGLPFPAVFLRYQPTAGKTRGVVRAAAAVGGGRARSLCAGTPARPAPG